MKVQMPLGKPQPWVLPVTLVCLTLGALIASMLSAKTQERLDNPNLRPEERIRLLLVENEKLQTQFNELRKRYDGIIDATTSDQKQREALQKEINELRIRAGSTAVQGPGIVVTLDDAGLVHSSAMEVKIEALLIHDVDLMRVINELRNAGAEALAINDERVASGSAIRCVGAVINVNNRPVSAPFVIRAIGKPDTLYGAVNLPYGVLDELRQLGIKVNVEKRELLRTPALTMLPVIEVGKPASEERR